MNYFKENKILSLLILLLVVMNISTIGFCWILWNKMEHHQNGSFGIQNPPPIQRNIIEDQLQLNAEQRKQFNDLLEQHFASRKVIDDKINSLRDQLFDLVKNDKPDTVAMHSIGVKIGELEAQKQLEIVKHFAALRLVCDKEQKEKFDVWINDVVKLIGPQGPPPPHDDNHNRPFPPPDHQGLPLPNGPPNGDNPPPR
jgi:hypothetical protein